MVDDLPEMAEYEQEPESGDEVAGEGMEWVRKPGLLGMLIYYHPLFFLGLSLVMLTVSWLLLPKAVKAEPPKLVDMYSSGYEALMAARDPLVPLPEKELILTVQQAAGDFDFIFRHPEFSTEVTEKLDWINPYLLYAESQRLYAERIPIERERVFEEASANYVRALYWEEKKRDEHDEKRFRMQYAPNKIDTPTAEVDEPPPEAVLRERQLRRRRYIRYQRAVTAVQAGRYHTAYDEFNDLQAQFQQEKLVRHREEIRPAGGWRKSTGPDLEPWPFELAEEDRIRIHYHLGTIYDRQGEVERAEREYRVFLLHAERGRERFLALMRLGGLYFARGKTMLRNASVGSARDETQLAGARRMFSAAADRYREVVEASAPETMLRRAYFDGGRAYLALAETMVVGRPTVWDITRRRADAVQQTLETFSNGRQLPERTQHALRALGRLWLRGGFAVPDPLSLSGQGALGLATTLGVQPRKTQVAERNALLTQARDFFEGAGASATEEYKGAARVMIARSLRVEGRLDQARKLFVHTRKRYFTREVELACLLGVTETYLDELQLERARVRYLGGVERQGSALLTPEDIKSWTGLCKQIHEESQAEAPSPGKHVWTLLPRQTRQIVREVSVTTRIASRYKPILLNRLNELLGRENLYNAKAFKDSILPEAALVLLQREPALLYERERQWLNRMLLDTALPQQILEASKGTEIAPFPPASRLTTLESDLLLSEDRIVRDLTRLSRAYVARANDMQESRGGELAREELRASLALERRALEDATDVNEYLLDNYAPGRADVLMQTADLFVRQARLAAAHPFLEYERARRLIARAGRTYEEAGKVGIDQVRGEEALMDAGESFFAAGQYGRVIQAFNMYLDRYGTSDRVGRASNLLGRAHVNLGQLQEAINVFRDNAYRGSPDGQKSLYYLGATYLLVGERVDKEGNAVDRLGDPDVPYPEVDEFGVQQVNTALQAFNEVRRIPELTPESRPWRWATFALGITWYRIAERAHRRELRSARAEDREPVSQAWLGYFEKAEAVLRESLERYRLKRSPADKLGLARSDSPQDYDEIHRLRLISEYYLARTLRERATFAGAEYDAEARGHLQHVIDTERYPDTMFEPREGLPLEIGRTVLGVTDGPRVQPAQLKLLRRNAFFLLAESWYDEGVRRENESPEAKTRAPQAFEKGLAVLRQARDQLQPRDAPQVLYLMAECLAKLNRRDEAVRFYRLAINAQRTLKDTEVDAEDPVGPKYWREMAEQRLRDLEYKEKEGVA